MTEPEPHVHINKHFNNRPSYVSCDIFFRVSVKYNLGGFSFHSEKEKVNDSYCYIFEYYADMSTFAGTKFKIETTKSYFTF